jgi:hypothetical protein
MPIDAITITSISEELERRTADACSFHPETIFRKSARAMMAAITRPMEKEKGERFLTLSFFQYSRNAFSSFVSIKKEIP